jgi:hypothetical protein
MKPIRPLYERIQKNLWEAKTYPETARQHSVATAKMIAKETTHGIECPEVAMVHFTLEKYQRHEDRARLAYEIARHAADEQFEHVIAACLTQRLVREALERVFTAPAIAAAAHAAAASRPASARVLRHAPPGWC